MVGGGGGWWWVYKAKAITSLALVNKLKGTCISSYDNFVYMGEGHTVLYLTVEVAVVYRQPRIWPLLRGFGIFFLRSGFLYDTFEV